MIDWALDSVDHRYCNLIFAVRKDHITNYSIDKILRDKFGPKIQIVVIDKITRGTLSTCLLAKNLINNTNPLVVYTPDVCFEPMFDPVAIYNHPNKPDGFLTTFKANNPAHSYARVENGLVVQTAEKEVISSNAAIGIYYFRSGLDFVAYGERMEAEEITTNGEFYVCPIYNLMIQDGKRVTQDLITKTHCLGTPEDLSFFTNRTLKRFGEAPVALCSDHSGFELKEIAKKLLAGYEIEFVDFGTYVQSDCDHHDFLSQAVRHIQEGTCDFGLSFCRTGQGFNIAANKMKGIRSALIFDEYMAEYAVRHNCANMFSLPSKYVSKDILQHILVKLQSSTFDGGRHLTRICKSEK